MGRIERSYQMGDEVGPLVKHMTQEAINLFEGSAGESGPSQFTDEATAKETLGTTGTVASGRMSLAFALEMLRKHFGPDVFNHTGMVDLRFLRPVRPGDTITFSGKIAETSPDAMVLTTPVATIGIRGTTVAGFAAAEGEENTISLLSDADGEVGEIVVSNAAGFVVINQAGDVHVWVSTDGSRYKVGHLVGDAMQWLEFSAVDGLNVR